MTSRFSAASERLESADNAESATARVADEGPYARPASMPPHRAVDAVLIDAIRASVGPFVPAPWRTASAASAATPAERPAFQELADESGSDESMALPWIESFLDTAESEVDATAGASFLEASGAGEPAVEEVVAFESFAEPSLEPASFEDASDALVLSDAQTASDQMDASVPESVAEPETAPIVAEEWPLEEAGAAMRALADDLVRHEDTPAPASEPEASGIASPDSPTPTLGMWSDDDMMDIMPVRTPVAPTESGEQWAARARRETQGAGNPESAAQALEALARRVRSGEIQLPAFSAEMGEAAALAAALAALLGVRR